LEDSEKTDRTKYYEEASKERAYYDYEDDDGRHIVGMLCGTILRLVQVFDTNLVENGQSNSIGSVKHA
jgi:hypothetical protein